MRGYQRLGEKRNGELLLNGYRVSIWGGKKQKEFRNSGDELYNILNVINVTEQKNA